MDNIQAALLIGQLARIEALWERRDALWRLYEKELHGLAKVRILSTVRGARHARHLFTVLVPPAVRDQLLWRVQNRGIGVAVNYRPIHLLDYYRKTFGYKEGDFHVAEEIGRSTLSLPLYPSLPESNLKYVVQVLREELNNP